MSEQKHTAGPWFTKREGFSTVYVEARLRQGVIQEVAACGPTEAGQEQQEANARLISAAPEMLEALELAAETLRRYEGYHRAKNTPESLDKAVANQTLAMQFEAIIAKATS